MLQYWHDNEVIEPMSRDPVVYSDDELKVARLLAPFGRLQVSIGTLRALAWVMRLILVEDESVPSRVAQMYKQVKAGKKGYLFVSPAQHSTADSDDARAEPWLWTEACNDLENDRAGRCIANLLTDHGAENPVVVVDVHYAVNTEMSKDKPWNDPKELKASAKR
jgi:hypothetical protein